MVVARSRIIAHRDDRAWTDLLTLPALVLTSAARGGRSHFKRHDAGGRTGSTDFGVTCGSRYRQNLQAASLRPPLLPTTSR